VGGDVDEVRIGADILRGQLAQLIGARRKPVVEAAVPIGPATAEKRLRCGRDAKRLGTVIEHLLPDHLSKKRRYGPVSPLMDPAVSTCSTSVIPDTVGASLSSAASVSGWSIWTHQPRAGIWIL
jgi:hypothetical protein